MIAALMSLFAAVAACEDPTRPEDLLDMTMRVQPVEVVAGDSVFIEVSVENRSASTVTVASPRSCLLDFEVTDSDGEIVATTGNPCLNVVGEHEFPAHYSRTEEYVWATTLPGEYGVRAVMAVLRSEPRRSDPVYVRVLLPGN
jgi:hypothetical protein